MTGSANLMTEHEKNGPVQVSATLIRSMLFYCEAIGLNSQALMTETGVSPAAIADPDGRLNESLYDSLTHHAAVQSKDDLFGLHMGQRLSLRQFGIIGFLIMNSTDIREALTAYERFQTTLGESLSLKLEEHKDVCRMTMTSNGGKLSGRHRFESFVSSLRAAVYELTNRELVIQKVMTTFENASALAEYQKAFGVVPEKGQINCIEFSTDFLNLKVQNPSPDMNLLLIEKLQKQLNQSASNTSLKVQREIHHRLGKGLEISLESFADFFAMSARSLQSKLKEEGTTFRELHEGVQKEFAILFLKSGRPIAEISYALEFSDASAFQRAFKRWTGEPPAFYRDKVS